MSMYRIFENPHRQIVKENQDEETENFQIGVPLVSIEIPELRQGGEQATKPPDFHRCSFQLLNPVPLKALQEFH